MEVLTEVPQTGTRLRIESDRQFEHSTGDSVLRVTGTTADGGQVTYDAVHIEVAPEDARLIATLIRETQSPTPRTHDGIAQDVLGAFGSMLSGRDAAQLAQIASRASWQATQRLLGLPETEAQERLERFAERLERAASKRSDLAFSSPTNGGKNREK